MNVNNLCGHIEIISLALFNAVWQLKVLYHTFNDLKSLPIYNKFNGMAISDTSDFDKISTPCTDYVLFVFQS